MHKKSNLIMGVQLELTDLAGDEECEEGFIVQNTQELEEERK